ncbi:hypothetical protein EOE67_00920 [Rheinheimera riviphila]|uniref:Lantibiotic biosynthesis protein n=1 Tax=Rheinheimera riviphila TaxID=1834037 RepID=A0A437R4T7_9GAMM|nr:lanthionine synthetase LanC family protein [Rheinheimera riviphila]RVU41791.1 hypothetical protein EOE67_00920 [Rheinheimera riviphila]
MAVAQASIRNIVNLLTEHIVKNLSPVEEPGFLAGRAGQLLFLWCAARSVPASVSNLQLEALLDDLSPNLHTPYPMSFGYGLSGIAWLYEFILNDTEYQADFNANTDMALGDYVMSVTASDEYEYVLGLNGIAAYAARRARHGQGVELVEKLVDKIVGRAQFFNEQECAWPTHKSSTYCLIKASTEQEFNLGLAHGVPGTLAALVALIPSITDKSKRQNAMNTLRAGCNWLLKAQQDPELYGSYFANLVGYPAKSRLGWCYGDATIALTLFRAGLLLSEQRFTDVACKISLHASSRSPNEAMIHDAGFCHGAAGLVLIFILLRQYYPHPKIDAVVSFWRDFVLQRFEQQGLAGFHKLKDGPDNRHFEEDSSFLSGYAGVGLCLLIADGQEPDWVDALLLA